MVMEINQIKMINKQGRRCNAALFALKHFRYLRTIVFVAASLYAAYVVDLASALDPQAGAASLLFWVKPLLCVFLIPILVSLIYMPLLYLIRWFGAKKPLIDPSWEGKEVTQTIYKKVSKLRDDRHAAWGINYDLDRHRYIKIPLALACAFLIFYMCVAALPQEELILTGTEPYTGGWYAIFAAAVVILGAIIYPCSALLYFLTDRIILFPYTRYSTKRKVEKLTENIIDDWKRQERKKKAEEAAAKKKEKELREKKIAAEKARRKKQEQEERLQKAEPLYQQAIAEEAVNEQLMKQAAELGHPKACIYMGRKMIDEQELVPHTESEKKQYQKQALKYLSVFEEDHNTEGVFLRLFAKTLYEEHHDLAAWQIMLNQARRIQASGNLPEQYTEACADLIEQLVREVDYAETFSTPSSAASYSYTPTTGSYSTFSAPLSSTEKWDYISKNCHGMFSYTGIQTIENDSSLTASQKEDLKTYLKIYGD